MPDWLLNFLLLIVSNLVVAIIWTTSVVWLLKQRKDAKKDLNEEYIEHRMEYDEIITRQQKEIIRVNQEIANGLRLLGVAMQVSKMRKELEPNAKVQGD